MPWLWLTIAGLFEIGWAIGLKASNGFTKPGPAALAIPAYVLSLIFLALAMKHLPLGTAYAAWTGMGIVGAVIAGILMWNEPANAARLCCIGLIIVGIAGLRIVTPAETDVLAPASGRIHQQ